MLLNISVRLRTEAEAMRYMLSPKTMLNIRGLVSGIFLGHLPHWLIQAIILVASALVVLVAAKRRASLPLAIVVAALVSYHLNAHDASVLIIPIALALSSASTLRVLSGTCALIIPGIAIATLLSFWAAIPFLVLFLAILAESDKSECHLLSVVSGAGE